jgi:tetratricopeptide (TPR) repeat protein
MSDEYRMRSGMQNDATLPTSGRTGHLLLAISLLLLGIQAGCQSSEQKAVQAAARSLADEDYDQATMLANESLDDVQKPEYVAELLYIRGRAFEQRPVGSLSQLQYNMQAARTSYVEALKRNPPTKLATYIRASLGKVAFYQDDFTVAIQQLGAAYPALDDKDLKAATLYHLAKAQQRSGQFLHADDTFAQVIRDFNGTEWARKAVETPRDRAFYVQLAVYKNVQSAEAASKMLRQRGLNPLFLRDQQQRLILRTGPCATYAQAKQLRDKTMDVFKDATIVP